MFDNCFSGLYTLPMKTAQTLDARGLKCPLPVLKARKCLGALSVGDVLDVLADDPAAFVDFPHFCAEQGHDFLGDREAPDGGSVFSIRKGDR